MTIAIQVNDQTEPILRRVVGFENLDFPDDKIKPPKWMILEDDGKFIEFAPLGEVVTDDPDRKYPGVQLVFTLNPNL